jgi:hypothetical protein
MTTIKVTVDGEYKGKFEVSSLEYARQTWTNMFGNDVKIEVCA